MNQIKKQTITEKNMQEGNDISKMFLTLDETSKNMVLIYLSALRDKQMISGGKDAS